VEPARSFETPLKEPCGLARITPRTGVTFCRQNRLTLLEPASVTIVM